MIFEQQISQNTSAVFQNSLSLARLSYPVYFLAMHEQLNLLLFFVFLLYWRQLSVCYTCFDSQI